MIRELIEEIELEKMAEAILFEDDIEKMAEAYIDELALELANEWLEKDAGVLKTLLGSRGAMMEATKDFAVTGARSGRSGVPNPEAFKQTAKSLLRRGKRLARTGAAKRRTRPVTGGLVAG